MVFTWNDGYLGLGKDLRKHCKKEENRQKKNIENEQKEKRRIQGKSNNSNNAES